MPTEIEVKALEVLRVPRTCTELGECLWGIYNGNKRQKRTNRQSYARPAGKIVKRLMDAKLVERAWPDGWERRSAQYKVKHAVRSGL